MDDHEPDDDSLLEVEAGPYRTLGPESAAERARREEEAKLAEAREEWMRSDERASILRLAAERRAAERRPNSAAECVCMTWGRQGLDDLDRSTGHHVSCRWARAK